MPYKIYLITRIVLDESSLLNFRWYCKDKNEVHDFIEEHRKGDNPKLNIDYKVETIYHCKA